MGDKLQFKVPVSSQQFGIETRQYGYRAYIDTLFLISFMYLQFINSGVVEPRYTKAKREQNEIWA